MTLVNCSKKKKGGFDMYLSLLNGVEKTNFLSLAMGVASADGNFSEEEQVMIESYCYEMQMEYNLSCRVPTQMAIDSLREESNENAKKIVVFELIGLALADNNFDKTEKKAIGDICKQFGVDKNYMKKCEDIILEYLGLQERINELVTK